MRCPPILRAPLRVPLVAVVVLSALLFGGLRPTDSFAETLTPSQEAAIRELAPYAASSSSRVDALLDQIGYEPSLPRATWQTFPTVRKIESAVLAAEAADPGRGGERALSIMSKAMAQEYGAAYHDPVLRSYVAAETPDRIAFAPELVRPGEALDRATRKAVLQLSSYAEGSRLGGLHSVLVRHAGVDSDTAYNILRTSASSEDAMLRAWERVPESERPRRLRAFASEVRARYGSASFVHIDLPPDPFGPQPNGPAGRTGRFRGDGGFEGSGFSGPGGAGSGPRTGPSGPNGGRPRSGVGGSSIAPRRPPVPGGGASANAFRQRYDSFVSRNYSAAGTRGFRAMRSHARGFGGVMFGNSVIDESGLGALDTLVWVPFHDADEWGQLLVWSTSGSQARFAPVRHEDAYVAARVVVDHIEGNGIGLVGVFDPIEYFECTAESAFAEGPRYRVVTHPEIASFDLGWSALMVDALPIQQSNLREMVARVTGDDGLERVDAWLSLDAGNWKVTDVPTIVSIDGSEIRLRRADAPASDATEGAWLDVHGFFPVAEEVGEAEKRQLYSNRFRAALPALTRACYDYERMSAFATVLSVYRWAHARGATCPVPEPRPAERVTPGSVVVTNEGFIALEDATSVEMHAELRDMIRGCLQETLDRSKLPMHRALDLDGLDRRISPIARRHAAARDSLEEAARRAEALYDGMSEADRTRMDVLAAEHSRQLTVYNSAPYGSAEEAAALREIERLGAAVDALPVIDELLLLDSTISGLTERIDALWMDAAEAIPEVDWGDLVAELPPNVSRRHADLSKSLEDATSRYYEAPLGSDAETAALSEVERLQSDLETLRMESLGTAGHADALLTRYVYEALAAAAAP